MPAISVGTAAEVEQQLRLLRRRLNLLTLQHALYVAGTVAALAAALLVLLAVRGDPAAFRTALGVALATAMVGSAGAAFSAWRRWLSLPQVARLADRQAGLDERLSTLLAARAQEPDSRLKGILLSQVVALGGRWTARAIAPRRAPRSLPVFLAALAILAATSFIARPPAQPITGAPGTVAGLHQPAAGPGALQQSPPATGKSQGAVALAEGADRSQGGGVEQAAGGDRDRDGTSGQFPDAGAASGSSDGATTRGGMAGVVRDAIRHAVGAPTDNTRRDGRDGIDTSRSARADATGGNGPSGDGRPSRGHAGPDGGRSTQAGAWPNGASSAASRAAQGPAGGAVASRGKGAGGQGGGGLFADGQAPSPSAGARGQPFAIKLTSFSAPAPTELEPQRRDQPVALTTGAGAPAAQRELSQAQVRDAPLRKIDVAPEHEAIVRRIFTRAP